MTTPEHPVTAPKAAGLTSVQALTIPLAGQTGIVAVMPVNAPVGRHYLRHHVYIHDWDRPQIRLDAEYLGYALQDQQQLVVVPISQWWYIGSYKAIPSTGVAHLAAIMAEPGLSSHWKEHATLMELGGPVAVTLQLGYAGSAKPQGDQPFYYELDELRESARAKRDLLDTQKAP